MADDTSDESDAPADESTGDAPEDEAADAESESDGESKSFRDRVEEIRQQRAEEGDGEGEEMSREERMEEMMGGGGGGPPGMGGGGGGGNPFAQMMGGMMGGGGGGPPGMGGGPGGHEEESSSKADEELAREVRKLRDEVHDARRELGRIADALED